MPRLLGQGPAKPCTAGCFPQHNSDAAESVMTVSPPDPLFALLSLPGGWAPSGSITYACLRCYQDIRAPRRAVGHFLPFPLCHRSESRGRMAPMAGPSCASSSSLGLGPGGGDSFLPSLSFRHTFPPSMPSVPCSPCMDTVKCFFLHFTEEAGAQDRRFCQGHRACEGQGAGSILRSSQIHHPKRLASRMDQLGPA